MLNKFKSELEMSGTRAVTGIALIAAGIFLFMAIFPEKVELLAIFLGLAILLLFLRIKHVNEEESIDIDFLVIHYYPEGTWSERYLPMYIIFFLITLAFGAYIVSGTILDHGWSLKRSIESAPIVLILFGIYELPDLFAKA